jgi:hypothetical protein
VRRSRTRSWTARSACDLQAPRRRRIGRLAHHALPRLPGARVGDLAAALPTSGEGLHEDSLLKPGTLLRRAPGAPPGSRPGSASQSVRGGRLPLTRSACHCQSRPRTLPGSESTVPPGPLRPTTLTPGEPWGRALIGRGIHTSRLKLYSYTAPLVVSPYSSGPWCVTAVTICTKLTVSLISASLSNGAHSRLGDGAGSFPRLGRHDQASVIGSLRPPPSGPTAES